MKSIFIAAVSVVILSGCSTIVEGRSQKISLNTTPSGASCQLSRLGNPIGRVSPTPGTVIVEKSRDDIIIECEKAGYKNTSYINKSDYAAASFGNIILGGGIGVGVDAATGAHNKYESPVNINLLKK